MASKQETAAAVVAMAARIWRDVVAGVVAMAARIWRDVVLVLGVACVVRGVSMWSAPAAWVVAGVLLLGLWALPYVRRPQKIG